MATIINSCQSTHMTIYIQHVKFCRDAVNCNKNIYHLYRDAVSYNFVGRVSSGLERCSSLVSPCGGLVFAGASNGTVHVWNSSTGGWGLSLIAVMLDSYARFTRFSEIFIEFVCFLFLIF